MIKATGLKGHSQESDVGHLLDWVYYHDALSRFSMHHWRHKSLTLEAADANHLEPHGLQSLPLTRYRPVCLANTFLSNLILIR